MHLIVDHPLASLRTNIHGTETVLDSTLAAGAVLLLASTSEIYGKNASDSLPEDSDRILGSPLKSRWTYAAAKGIDEAFAHAYWREFGLQVSIVRLFNTVGPRQTGRYGMVVPSLVRQALLGEPLTVYGDGRQTRCFSYVKDVVPALIADRREHPKPRPGLQPRRLVRGVHPGSRAPHRPRGRQRQPHQTGPLRGGLRRRLRRHATSGPGQHQGPRRLSVSTPQQHSTRSSSMSPLLSGPS